VRYEDLRSTAQTESAAAIRERIVVARKRQLDRYPNEGIYSNALMKPKHIKKYCRPDDDGRNRCSDQCHTPR
jgi:magnesium chelatase family protein